MTDKILLSSKTGTAPGGGGVGGKGTGSGGSGARGGGGIEMSMAYVQFQSVADAVKLVLDKIASRVSCGRGACC
jgi:hypothetical protein